MSIGEAQRGTAAAPAHSEREPLWAIGLSALLIATGLARRPAARYSAARYSGRADNSGRADSSGRADNNELDPGRGRFAEGPSEIPARGWKDIILRVYEGI